MKRYLYIVLILFSAILNCRAAYYGFRISNLNGGIKYHYGNGYLTCSRAGKVTPYFYVRDHLGSVRAALTQTGAVRQITNYYAYGTFMGDVSKGYVIKTDRYTGKELDREAGLDLYDYGARQYDATVGLFTSMDPMCEQNPNVNPYLYCHANPVNRIDPDGRDDYYTSNGQFLFRDQKETDRIMIRNNYVYAMSKIAPVPWQIVDTPIENVNLSAEAYSNIFTNILSKMENVNVEELHNQKVSVTVWERSNDNLGMYTSDQYNDAGLSGETLAETGKLQNGDRVIICYIYPQGTKEKSIINTVSNVQNLLGAHESLGHYKNGGKSHNQVVPFQRNHKSWQKTTNDYKNYINDVYKK